MKLNAAIASLATSKANCISIRVYKNLVACSDAYYALLNSDPNLLKHLVEEISVEHRSNVRRTSVFVTTLK